MQNTKKHLFLTLAIIFCAPINLPAMDHHQVNPYLSPAEKILLEKRIKNMEDTINSYANQMSDGELNWLRKKLEHNKKIYYGNKPTTRKEIVKMDYQKTIWDKMRHAIGG